MYLATKIASNIFETYLKSLASCISRICEIKKQVLEGPIHLESNIFSLFPDCPGKLGGGRSLLSYRKGRDRILLLFTVIKHFLYVLIRGLFIQVGLVHL